MKNSKITTLFWVLVFSFMYLVSVHPMNRTKMTKIDEKKIGEKSLQFFEYFQQKFV